MYTSWRVKSWEPVDWPLYLVLSGIDNRRDMTDADWLSEMEAVRVGEGRVERGCDWGREWWWTGREYGWEWWWVWERINEIDIDGGTDGGWKWKRLLWRERKGGSDGDTVRVGQWGTVITIMRRSNGGEVWVRVIGRVRMRAIMIMKLGRLRWSGMWD